MSNDPSLANERFGFTVFLSACVHVMLIAGVGFSFLGESPEAPAIEITLAQYESETAPEQADFIAQANQQGSGSLDEIVAPSTPHEAELNDDEVREVSPVRQPAPDASADSPVDVVTAQTAENRVSPSEQDQPSDSEQPQPDVDNPEELRLAIASLQARLDRQQQAYANRPRRYTISSASTQQRHDALYLDNWRRRIETVGNRYYPDQARQQNVFGSLRMMVALRPDGSVTEIRILESSGEQILDQAAADIVQRASPFDPFPDELRGEVDILEIIRTWRFHRGNSFSSEAP
ncbi:MAG: energy transducer TonB [Pseudohongiellaceae bacterium]